MIEHDSIFINSNLASISADNESLGVIKNAAIAHRNGKISYVGKMEALCEKPEKLASHVIDMRGKWLTPGFIDCHTHIVFGGDRAKEFKLRLSGASYEEIAKQGGGIRSTVAATRSTPEDTLFTQAKARVCDLIQDGVTTMEIKSGYGLDLENERKMLRVARRIGEALPVRILNTFLGAHALPKEYTHDRAKYIDLICNEMIPQLAKENLIDAVDAFCETIAFTVDEVERVFSCAKTHGFPVKLHAEQLTNCHGSALAARFGALSADHLEYLDERGVAAMASSGTVAVLLPGAFFMLRETKVPPIDLLRKFQVPIAVATDCNPGTSPTLSLRLMCNMACQQFGLTVEEGLRAITLNAAKALGIDHKVGSLEVGKDADILIWDINGPEEIAYWLGGRQPVSVIKGGVVSAGKICD